VDPGQYGEDREVFCGRVDPPRDAVEIQLIRWAAEDRKPVLAVCRGIQVVNVAMGGTLYQDVARQLPQAMKHDYFPTKDNPSRDYLAHTIDTRRGSRLGDALGAAPALVNSMHHQAIKQLAPGLAVTAHAADGVIEAVEADGPQFLVGVQWHPEELAERDPGMYRLFTAFVDAAN